jgi:hypothetical protein
MAARIRWIVVIGVVLLGVGAVVLDSIEQRARRTPEQAFGDINAQLDRRAIPIGRGTIVGYDEVAEGKHVTDIELFKSPAGVYPARKVAVAHEGDQVDILEERDHGDTLLVRTSSGVAGWTQGDFVKR